MKLRLQTTDSFGEKYDNTFTATKETTNLGTKYSYSDEIAKVRIFVLKDKIQIIRDGEVKSNQLLKEGDRTNFSYKSPYMNRTLQIFTEKLKVEEKKIEASYTIFQGEETLNKLNLIIEEL